MDEKDFELFQILRETENITKAADRLFITQSALSKRIRAMEQELGVELLLRSRQGVRFTPYGEEVLRSSQAAARELSGMRTRLEAMRGEVCGTLKAGVSINYALYQLPELLAAYHQAYPKVNLQISTGQSRDLYRQMQEGSLDTAILRGEFPWEGERILISRERVMVVCAKELEDHPLKDLPYISRKTDPMQESDLLRWRDEQGLGGQPTGIRVDSLTTCVEMVRLGLGWSMVPEIALRDFDGCARPCVFENGEPLLRGTSLLCQKEAMRLPQVRAFAESVKKPSPGRGWQGQRP